MPDLNGVPQLAEEKHHIGRQALANIAANPEYLRQSARQAVGPLGIRQQPGHFLLKLNGGRLPVFSLWQLAVPRTQALVQSDKAEELCFLRAPYARDHGA